MLFSILTALNHGPRFHSRESCAPDVNGAEAWVESMHHCQQCNGQFQSQNHLLAPMTSKTKIILRCRVQTLQKQSPTIHSLLSIVNLKGRLTA